MSDHFIAPTAVSQIEKINAFEVLANAAVLVFVRTGKMSRHVSIEVGVSVLLFH